MMMAFYDTIFTSFCTWISNSKWMESKKHVLLGVTGSVAAIKVPVLVKSLTELSSIKVEVKVVSTERGLHFFDGTKLPVTCHVDAEEWEWKEKGDPVLHIELRKWADLIVIAPLDANTMAKMASGICDNLLTCVVRAWDPSKPFLYCPAMNTVMWDHPLTAKHIAVLEELGYVQVPPVTKLLVCGDHGVGAMASVDDIVKVVVQHLALGT